MVDLRTKGALDHYYEEYQRDPDYIAEGLAIHFIEDVLNLMEEQGVTRDELAKRMGVSSAYISKLLNAPPNLTLRSVVRVAIALDANVFLGLRNSEGSRHARTLRH